MKSDLHKYQIDRSFSLQKIAENLGLNAKQLKDFHNTNSLPHEWIKDDDTFPQWLECLYIPDSEINLIENKKRRESLDFVSLKQASIDKSKYKINQKIDLQISGNSMIDSETEIIWEVSKRKEENSFYSDIKQVSHQVKYIKSIYRQFAEYMQKFNKPLEHLVIEITDAGNIQSVANQDEIWSNWVVLRKSLETETDNTIEEKNILEGGDKDFQDTLPLIKNNILYNLFFNDCYSDYNVTGKFVEQKKEQYNSQAFNNEKVNITVKRKVEKEGDIAKIKFLCESDSDHNEHLKEIYNSRLKEFLKENYDYSLIWSIEYHFDIEKGMMLFCQSKIKERTSSNYIHSMEHKIELI